MPYRKETFTNGEYYHVCNRSVGDEKIFTDKTDSEQILKVINYYRFTSDKSLSNVEKLNEKTKHLLLDSIFRTPPIIEILAFALMPNHYHFVFKQLKDNGITKFITDAQNSFAKYFNIKRNRHGALFDSRFKAVQILSENQLIHVIRYVDLNPVTSYLLEIKDLETYPYGSFTTYMGIYNHVFLTKDFILAHFKTPERYRNFVFNQSNYQRSLKRIKKIIFD